jgi:hypothetical protein
VVFDGNLNVDIDDSASDIDYTPERLTWVVELVVQLDAARDESKSTKSSQSTVRTQLDVNRTKAKDLRERLMDKLGRVAAGDELTEAVLDGAGAAPTDSALADSLKAIASIIQGVLASTDPNMAILAQCARLTDADATAATDAASSVTQAKAEVALGGPGQADRDTPAVNLVEGRVLYELLFLRDAFDEARKRGVAAPALIPPTSLRHVLSKAHPRKSVEPTASPNAAVAPPKPKGS